MLHCLACVCKPWFEQDPKLRETNSAVVNQHLNLSDVGYVGCPQWRFDQPSINTKAISLSLASVSRSIVR